MARDEHKRGPGHAVRQQAEQRDPARRESRRGLWHRWLLAEPYQLRSRPKQYSPAALARLPRSDAARVVHASASAFACACAVLAHCFLCVCAVVWIVWAYTPDWVLESLGVTYYPDRYWAIALPMFGLSLVCYLIVVYNAWNLCNTHPFHSYYTIQDSADMATRVKDKDMHAFQATDSIPPAEDIPITKINRLLFCTPQSD